MEAPTPTQDERLFAMLCHLTSLVIGWIGPLIFWLIKKDESPFVDDQGKEALNFQITVFICMMSLGFFACFLGPLVVIPGAAVVITDLVFTIMATIRSYEGQRYRYPLCIRLIK